MSLKILQVISTPPFAWATGGCARVTFDLSRQLVKNGNEVTILTTDMYKPEQRYEKCNSEYVEGIKVVRYRNVSNYLAWKFKFYFAPSILNSLKNQIKGDNYDIIHLQDLISIHAFFTAYYCFKYKKPYIITTHGSVPWLKKSNIVNKLYYPFAKYILKNSCKIISLNKSEKEMLEKIGINSNSIEIIPNGISLSEFKDIKSGAFRKKYGIGFKKKIVLYLGRIHQSKGLDLLIRSFNEVYKKNKDVILVIIGPDDGFLSNYKSLTIKLNLQDQILFLDALYGIEKMEAYTDANIFATLKFTGFPMTFLESCSCNTPIITTKHGDTLDWVNKVGIISEYDKNKVSESIMKILYDSEFNQELINNCKIAVTNFSWVKLSKIMENVYESCS